MDEPLDADEAGRVLRRARSLAAEHGVDDDTDAVLSGLGVSGQALVEAAAEVGIDPDSVRDALALERFDADLPDRGRLDRLAGRVLSPLSAWCAASLTRRLLTQKPGWR